MPVDTVHGVTDSTGALGLDVEDLESNFVRVWCETTPTTRLHWIVRSDAWRDDPLVVIATDVVPITVSVLLPDGAPAQGAEVQPRVAAR